MPHTADLQWRCLEEDLCWIVPHVPPTTRRFREWTELNWTAHTETLKCCNAGVNVSHLMSDAHAGSREGHVRTVPNMALCREKCAYNQDLYSSIVLRWLACTIDRTSKSNYELTPELFLVFSVLGFLFCVCVYFLVCSSFGITCLDTTFTGGGFVLVYEDFGRTFRQFISRLCFFF